MQKIHKFHTSVHVHPDVQDAIKSRKPVVALESTIISHGMPYPANIDMAKRVEAVVRAAGAIPATCAIISGFPKVGLQDSDFELLARNGVSGQSYDVMKCSRRDMAFAIASSRHAATTVSGTMILAHSIGINVLATGGIGGVHRGAEVSMDISADLQELGRTPMAVVCAGVKSILDIPKTLEVLESYGVPVVGYQTKIFPAFYTDNSGYQAPLSVNSPEEVARMLSVSATLGLSAGLVVAVPPPSPIPAADINAAIAQALKDAEQRRVSGAAVTPFLLAAVKSLTDGASLETNIDLVLNNARVAAEIAVAHAALSWNTSRDRVYISRPDRISIEASVQKDEETVKKSPAEFTVAAPCESSVDIVTVPASLHPSWYRHPQHGLSAPEVIVVGAAIVDRICTPTSEKGLVKGSSSPGKVAISYGGVGANISTALSRDKSRRVAFCTAVGNDDSGRDMLLHLSGYGIDVSESVVSTRHATGSYTAVHEPQGDLLVAIADVPLPAVLHPELLVKRLQNLMSSTSRYVVLGAGIRAIISDCNISDESMAALGDLCAEKAIPLVVDPTSDVKCIGPIRSNTLHLINLIKPNVSELVAMNTELLDRDLISRNRGAVATIIARATSTSLPITDVSQLATLATSLLWAMRRDGDVVGKNVVVTLGAMGVLWVGPAECFSHSASLRREYRTVIVDDCTGWTYIPAIPLTEPPVSTNGAGDAFLAGIVGSVLSRPRRIGELDLRLSLENVTAGLNAANRHLLSSNVIS